MPEDEGAIEGKDLAGATRSLAGGLFVAGGGSASRGKGDSSSSDDDSDDDDDDSESDAAADDDDELAFEARAAAGAAARAKAAAAQNPLLYAAEGQFNPHAARAAKKRAKRVSAATTKGSAGVAAAAADALAEALQFDSSDKKKGKGKAVVSDEPYNFNEAFNAAGDDDDEGHSSGVDEDMG